MRLIRDINGGQLTGSLLGALVVKVSLAYLKVSAVIYHFLLILF
jgi:hypothetical protein